MSTKKSGMKILWWFGGVGANTLKTIASNMPNAVKVFETKMGHKPEIITLCEKDWEALGKPEKIGEYAVETRSSGISRGTFEIE